MTAYAAAVIAMIASFAVFTVAAIWYVVPHLERLPLPVALTPLLWIHAFRYVALQVFSSQALGFDIPDSIRDRIVYGDLAGMLLALASLIAWRLRWRLAGTLTLIFVAATVVDLANAAVAGVRHGLFDLAGDVTWMILTFYVPLLWVSVVLVAWQLWSRREEAVARR